VPDDVPTKRPPPAVPPVRVPRAPGVPTRFDNPEAVAAAQRSEQLAAALAKARAELAFERRAKVDQEAHSPRSAAPFELKIRDLKGWAGFLKSWGTFLGVLAAIGMGVWNKVEKVEKQPVRDVETKIDAVELKVSGKTDQQGASSKGESLSERVEKLEKQVRPLAEQRCLEQQWLAQVLDKVGAHDVKVQNCEAPKVIDVVEEQSLERGRPQPRREYVIRTPMPAPNANP
jgi:hypothetical protein